MAEVNFRSLADCISRGDHQAFLRSYMQLVIAGKNLVVPTTLDYLRSKEAWEQILYGVPGGYTDAFLVNLTTLWIQLLKRHGGRVTDKFAGEILALLENKAIALAESPVAEAPPPSVSEAKSTTVQPIKPVTIEERLREARPDLLEVKGSVTEDYYKQKRAEELIVPGPSVAADMKTAYDTRQVDRFLIAYLQMQLGQVKPRVPLSSVPDVIFHMWSDILIEHYNKVPSRPFLEQLAARWFYVVNQQGLPASRESLKKVLHLLLSENVGLSGERGEPRRSSSKPVKGKGGLLDKLNRLF